MLTNFLTLGLLRRTVRMEVDLAVAPIRRTAMADYDSRPVWPSKDPDDRWDYSLDWSRLISDETDTIIFSAVKKIDGDVLLHRHGYQGQVSTIWLERGSPMVNKITVHMKTQMGREGDQTIDLTVAQR